MAEIIDLEKTKRESLRWMILYALHAAQPIGTSEAIVRQAIEPVVPGITLIDIRRELDYLDERGLITVTEKDSPCWFAKANRHGIDIVEYTVECHPGIARPRRW